MKTKLLLLTLLLFTSISGFSTIWIVNNSGSTFSPATITITAGDTVNFVISSNHNANEVSLATWNANGTTHLAGGFQTAFGGGQVLPALLGVGTHYYVCSAHAFMGMKGQIIVLNCTTPVTPAAISGNAAICAATSNTYSVTAVSGATSYTWTLPGGWSGTSTTNAITATSSTTSGNVIITANNGCGPSAQRTLAVTVTAIPSIPTVINGPPTVCLGDVGSYSITAVSGATSYSWSAAVNGDTGSGLLFSTSISIADVISVTANNSCGVSSPATLNVNVNTIPNISPLAGNATICPNSTQTYNANSFPGATYNWTLPSGWTGSSTTSQLTVTAGSSGGTIYVNGTNICGTSPTDSLVVAVSAAIGAPTLINGDTSVCESTTNIYSVSPVAGATLYTWTLPSGWSGSSTVDSIITVAGSLSGTITVSANDACGSSVPQILNVTSNSAPSTPVTITGSTSICAASTNNYSISSVAGTTSYTWTLPANWTGNSTADSITTTADTLSGNITVTADNTCGSSVAQSLNVTVNNINTSVSQSGNILTSLSGSSFQWLDCSSFAPLAGETNQSFTASVNGNYAVLITQNGCSDTSLCYNVSTVGLAENNEIDEITIYPNPSNGLFQLDIKGSEFDKNSVIEIYTLQGKKIFQSKITNSISDIDMSNYSKGIYFIRISNGKTSITKKIIAE